MHKIILKGQKKISSIFLLLFVFGFIASHPLMAQSTYEVECGLNGEACMYTRQFTDVSELRKLVMTALDPSGRGTYFEQKHLENTFIDILNEDTLLFTSNSNECINPTDKSKKMSCLELIKQLMTTWDRRPIERPGKSFTIRFVFYEYDLNKAKNFSFGFTGFSGAGEADGQPPRFSLGGSGEEVASPIQSLVLNAGNRLSDMLSLNLSLGHLGGYIESVSSIVTLPMSHGQSSLDGSYGTQNLYPVASVDSLTSTPVVEKAGFSFSGTLKEVVTPGGKNMVRFSGFDFYYGIPTGRSTATDFSLINLINPATGGNYSFAVEPGKPYPLFEISSVTNNKLKNTAISGITRNKGSKYVNIIGALYVEENEELDPQDMISDGVDASGLDFNRAFYNADLRFDPIIVPSIRSNSPAKKGKKNQTSGQAGEYQTANYFLKLHEKDLTPEMYDEMVEVSIVDSPVMLMGGKEIISVGKLAKQGLHFGITRRDENAKIDISSLEFTVKIRLAKSYYQDEERWTTPPVTNSQGERVLQINYAKYKVIHSLKGGKDTFRKIGKPETFFLPFK